MCSQPLEYLYSNMEQLSVQVERLSCDVGMIGAISLCTEIQIPLVEKYGPIQHKTDGLIS